MPPLAPQSYPWRAPYRIETARLNLCALGPEHVGQLHEVIPKNKAHLESTMPWAHAEPLSYGSRTELLTQMRSNFDLGVDFVLGIFERASNCYIGGTGLHPRAGPHALEIGYWLAADAQGKGLVTESVVALASVAFETMGGRRLEIRCSPTNLKSRAIPERLGFQLDGILRDGGVSGSGELEDKMVWSLLAKEYRQHALFTAPRPKLFDVLDRPIERLLDLKVEAMLAADAEVISRWRYSGRYALYDGRLSSQWESARYMLDPRNGFRAIRGVSGLVGFCSFGIDGRVPGGSYDDDALDVGAGMDPALVGSGRSRSFLGAIVEYARRELNAVRLRATVASWNERAIRASCSVGFRPISRFRTHQGSEFAILVRDVSDVSDVSDVPGR